jgi:hypothetical protein
MRARRAATSSVLTLPQRFTILGQKIEAAEARAEAAESENKKVTV